MSNWNKKKVSFNLLVTTIDEECLKITERMNAHNDVTDYQNITSSDPIKIKYTDISIEDKGLCFTCEIHFKKIDKKLLKEKVKENIKIASDALGKRIPKSEKEKIKEEALSSLYLVTPISKEETDGIYFKGLGRIVISKKFKVISAFLPSIFGTCYGVHSLCNLQHLDAALTNLYTENDDSCGLGRYSGSIGITFGEEDEADIKKAKLTGDNPLSLKACLETAQAGRITICPVTVDEFIFIVNAEDDKVSGLHLSNDEKMTVEKIHNFIDEALKKK